MDIGNCLRALIGSTELRGTRPTRTIIRVNTRSAIQVWGASGWYHWAPCFSDLVAIDWEVIHEKKLIEMIAAQIEEANAAAQAG